MKNAISSAHTRMIVAEMAGDSLAYAKAFLAAKTLICRSAEARAYAGKWIAQPVYKPSTMMQMELDRLCSLPSTGPRRSRIAKVKTALRVTA